MKKNFISALGKITVPISRPSIQILLCFFEKFFWYNFNIVLILFSFAILDVKSEILFDLSLVFFNFFKLSLLNFFFKNEILFFGRYLRIKNAAYLYSKPEERNFNLYFFAINLAPVVLPLAAEPSAAIWNLSFGFNFKISI